MKFSYSPFSREHIVGAREGIIYKPTLPIIVHGPTGTFGLDALADTGSDQILFPRYVASLVGVSLGQQNSAHVSGVGEKRMPIFFVDGIELSLQSDGQAYRWPARVWFSDSDEMPALLGHIDFLQFFTSTFDGKTHELALEPNKEFPGKLTDLWKR
ncbi:MAG: hypothetical protein A3E36_01770 [Candidatus Andersenbacteria bacterium RIFCSPHIGHO2_12_FULL_45_11b]|uniref:Peptidase A2 domain-containing protein n=1 Tax=Candidatus Andersenbacteria bacterium RIFCSPHIGHO2_12_FULL_45_11b TaxID=1797282 RepID=A0A1G1X5W7_9BACT|nr:MAG: hypothetical protein A3E36_01770 [Candidatus Andersenbacteria bacterium RIFCSPHIGHO2_12_FULL_45_11b]